MVSNNVVVSIRVDKAGIGYQTSPAISIGAPATPPALTVRVAEVGLDLKLRIGEIFQVVTSTNLTRWIPLGDTFLANAELITVNYEVRGVQSFYRVAQTSTSQRPSTAAARRQPAEPGQPLPLELDLSGAVASSMLVNLTAQPVRRAAGIAVIVNGFVVRVNITDGGFGYTVPPSVQFVGGGGEDADALASVSNSQVTRVTIENAGSNYSSVPTVVIAEPPVPPFVPELAVRVVKVAVDLKLTLGNRYQLFSSSDQITWGTMGAPFTAENEQVTREFDPADTGQYFKILEVQ